MKKRSKFKKVIISLVCVILACILLMIASIFFISINIDKKLDSVPFVNVAEVSDGVYIGNMDTTLVKVTVEVSISDHRIIDIRLLRHINGRGQKAEKIIDDMFKMNTTDVEIVSGATMSSKVIIAAVKDALIKGVK